MAFALFILVNAVLFTRPAEVVESLQALPIYYVVMTACLAVSLPAMLYSLTQRSVYTHPSFLCISGFCITAMLSIFVNSMSLAEGGEEAIELTKTFLYLVVFLALIDRPVKLRTIVVFLTIFGMISTTLALLNYFEIVQVTGIKTANENSSSEGLGDIKRLQFSGILQDPNEACVYLAMLCIYALHGLTDKASGIARVLWLLPLGLFLPAIALTQSRGGLLAFIVGLVTYWTYAFGRRAILYGLLGVPLILVAFAGRQTTFQSAETGTSRVGLWSDWMDKFRSNPILGVGPKIKSVGDPVGVASTLDPEEKSQRPLEHLAHNSYLQAFADNGLMGGIFFVGAFCFAFTSMQGFAFRRVRIVDPVLRRLHPCVMGATAVYAMGMLTLSLNYIVVTFFTVAVPIAFVSMTETRPRVQKEELTPHTFSRVIVVSIAILAFVYVMIRLFRDY